MAGCGRAPGPSLVWSVGELLLAGWSAGLARVQPGQGRGWPGQEC